MQHIIKTLVRTQSCKIDQCSCGAVHVSVGSMTVRITENATRELHEALSRAMVEIDGRHAPAPTPVIHLVDSRGVESNDGPRDASRGKKLWKASFVDPDTGADSDAGDEPEPDDGGPQFH
jgi:hypothetical protein